VSLSPRRQTVLVVLALALVPVAVLAVPARAYLAQRGVLGDREAALAELERSNDELEGRLEHLGDPGEIERIARRDYGLVAAGEESYAILPPATAGVVLPGGWPFDRISGPFARAATGGS